MIEFMFLRVRMDVVTTAEGCTALVSANTQFCWLLVGQFGVAIPFR
jgi:hypothetical protein